MDIKGGICWNSSAWRTHAGKKTAAWQLARPLTVAISFSRVRRCNHKTSAKSSWSFVNCCYWLSSFMNKKLIVYCWWFYCCDLRWSKFFVQQRRTSSKRSQMVVGWRNNWCTPGKHREEIALRTLGTASWLESKVCFNMFQFKMNKRRNGLPSSCHFLSSRLCHSCHTPEDAHKWPS